MLKKLFRRIRATGNVQGSDAEPRERYRLKRWAVRPDGWKSPRGYENGVLVEGGGRTLYIAGQVAWNADQEIVGGDNMAKQFVQALDNVLTVLAEAGGRAEEIVRMTVYVTDKQAYMAATGAIGEAWRDRIGHRKQND